MIIKKMVFDTNGRLVSMSSSFSRKENVGDDGVGGFSKPKHSKLLGLQNPLYSTETNELIRELKEAGR